MTAKVSKFAVVFEGRKRMEEEESQPPESQPPKPPLPSRESQLTQSQPQQDQPRESQPYVSQPHHGQLNLMAALPDAKGHLEIPHQLTDHLFRHLDTYEQAVYLQLYRLSWGHKNSRCRISNERLAERTNISVSKIKVTTKSLEGKGLIKKVAMPHGLGVIQGVEYEVAAPSWGLQRSQSRQSQLQESQPPQDPNKEKLLKETDKAINCPDCFGTNFWYPEGTNKGVKKCSHERMKNES